jgi:hypothetical protein
MLIFDLLKEQQSKKKYTEDKDGAFVAFVNQKKALDFIKGTQ